MTPNRVLSALRQLACLGFGGKAVLPEAIEVLRAAVRFEFAAVFHLHGDFRLADAHVPAGVPPMVLLDYAENFHNRPHGDGVYGLTVEQLLQGRQRAALSSRYVERRDLQRTEFYNRISRPVDLGWSCQMPLRDGNRPLANMVIGRPFTCADFTAAEVRLIEHAQPWFSHLLARPATPVAGNGPGEEMETGDTGSVVIDAAARLQAASPGALLLLHMAAARPITAAQLRASLDEDLRVLLRDLALAVDIGRNGAKGPPPARSIRNVYGSFQLRAYALDAFAGDRPPQVVLHVERRVPWQLRLFRAARFLMLTPREREVCVAVLAGQSRTEIAARLGLKPSSVIQHTKSLYNRLGIGGRQELLAALLAAQPA